MLCYRPLPYRFPEKEFLKHELFALWREFFDFRAVNEFGQAVDVEALTKDDTYLLAQLPHAIMVRRLQYGPAQQETT